jgi:hypothetical protein
LKPLIRSVSVTDAVNDPLQGNSRSTCRVARSSNSQRRPRASHARHRIEFKNQRGTLPHFLSGRLDDGSTPGVFMPTLLTIKEAAKRLGCPPRRISDAAYEGRLGDDCFHFIGGRRVVAETALDKIARALRRPRRDND